MCWKCCRSFENKHVAGKNTSVHEKMLAYNRANREVAVLCNHQRAVPKTYEQSMEKLKIKKKEKKAEIKEIEGDLKKARLISTFTALKLCFRRVVLRRRSCRRNSIKRKIN